MASNINNMYKPASLPAVHLNSVDQEFRQWLKDRGFWSINAERLFLCFAHQPQIPMPVSKTHRELLKQVIIDAHQGINITERYPAFFRDLLQQPSLRHAFITAANTAMTPV